MKITQSHREEVLVIGLEGNLTTWEQLEIGQQLKEAIDGAKGVVVFDLSEVKELDDCGIGLLRESNLQLGSRGLNLILAGARATAADALRNANISSQIAMATSVDQAVTMAAPTVEIDPSSLLDELNGEEL